MIYFFVYCFFIVIYIYDSSNPEGFDVVVFLLQDDRDWGAGFQDAYNIFHV